MKLRNWICLAWVQIVLVSFIATLSRGTLNALNAVGGLGTGDVQTATAVNLLSSISFTLLSWLSGAIVNLIGYRCACALGATTTTITLTTLMCYTMFHIVPAWSVWTAAWFDGIGSGCLWTAAGTLLIKYPSQAKKGFASTVLFAIYSCGAALGGLLSFAMNLNSSNSTTKDALNDYLRQQNIPPSVEDGLPLEPIVNAGLKPASYSVMIFLAAVSLILCTFLVHENRVTNSSGQPLQLNLASPMRSSFDEVSECPDLDPDSEERSDAHLKLSQFSNSHPFRLFEAPPSCHPSRLSSRAPSRIGSRAPSRVGSRAPSRIDSHPPTRQGSRADSRENTIIRSVSKAVFSASKQFTQLAATFKEKQVQLLVIYSFASLFHQTYLFNGINYKAFNVRTRGLNCFMYWVGRIPAGFIHGYLVDDLRFPTRIRALHGMTLLLSYVATCQCLAVIFWAAVPEGIFDVVVDPAKSALAFVSFFLYGGLDTVSQSFILWIFSVLGRRHPSRVPHYVAIFRCYQGLGSSLAWALDLNSFASYRSQFLVCALCWLMAFPGLGTVVYNLPRDDVVRNATSSSMTKVAPRKLPSRRAQSSQETLSNTMDGSTQPSDIDKPLEVELVRV